MSSKAKRRASMLAAIQREEADGFSRLRAYRDELALAGMAIQDAGGGFPHGLSLALDRAQDALEEAQGDSDPTPPEAA